MSYIGRNPKFNRITIANALATGADADTQLTISDYETQVVTPTANRTYKLPTTGVIAGMTWTIWNDAAVNSSDFQIAVQSSGANLVRTIWAQTSATFRAKQATPTTAAHWVCLTPAMSNWTSITPVWVNAPGTKTGFYRRVGSCMEMRVLNLLTGAVTGVVGLTIPLSKTIGTGELTGTGNNSTYMGNAECIAAAGSYRLGTANYDSATTLRFLDTATGSNYWDATHPATWASGDIISGVFSVPITGWSANGG